MTGGCSVIGGTPYAKAHRHTWAYRGLNVALWGLPYACRLSITAYGTESGVAVRAVDVCMHLHLPSHGERTEWPTFSGCIATQSSEVVQPAYMLFWPWMVAAIFTGWQLRCARTQLTRSEGRDACKASLSEPITGSSPSKNQGSSRHDRSCFRCCCQRQRAYTADLTGDNRAHANATSTYTISTKA